MAVPFNLTDPFLARICLPSAKRDQNYPLPGTTAIAIGWGQTELGGSPSNNLKQITLKIMKDSSSSCSQPWFDTKTQMCATASDK
ncbi:unnamed protein product, partial [Rotaria sp. Silwood1]